MKLRYLLALLPLAVAGKCGNASETPAVTRGKAAEQVAAAKASVDTSNTAVESAQRAHDIAKNELDVAETAAKHAKLEAESDAKKAATVLTEEKLKLA